jgi:ParB family chromosome partitioning protein
MQDYAMTQDQVSRRVGKSRPAITNTLRLLQLPDEVTRLIRESKLSAGMPGR